MVVLSTEELLIVFGVAQFAFGANTQARRLAVSAYANPEHDHYGGQSVASSLAAVGAIAWPFTMIAGLLSLYWLWVLAIFLGAGIAGSIAYTAYAMMHQRTAQPNHWLWGAISGATIGLATGALWASWLASP